MNYHHLQYFWSVAKEGNLTRAAARFRVAPSAVSAQIRQLEDQFGEPLFARRGRRLELTEAGRVALAYAEDIFTAGRELEVTLTEGRARTQILRIGAVATLSRNFQLSFVEPLLTEPGIMLQMVSGSEGDLLARLEAHSLDLVLTNRPVPRDDHRPLRCQLVARQRVSFVGRPRRRRFRFPHDLATTPVLLPGHASSVRASFDALCDKLQITPRVRAEVDDMAMLRVLVTHSDALALLPPVVVRDELRLRLLRDWGGVPGLHEDFYAVLADRRFPHPLVRVLLARSVREILATDGSP